MATRSAVKFPPYNINSPPTLTKNETLIVVICHCIRYCTSDQLLRTSCPNMDQLSQYGPAVPMDQLLYGPAVPMDQLPPAQLSQWTSSPMDQLFQRTQLPHGPAVPMDQLDQLRTSSPWTSCPNGPAVPMDQLPHGPGGPAAPWTRWTSCPMDQVDQLPHGPAVPTDQLPRTSCPLDL